MYLRPNVKPKTIQVPEENTRKISLWLCLPRDFLDTKVKWPHKREKNW